MHNINENIFFTINGLAGANHYADSFFVHLTSYYTIVIFILLVTILVFLNKDKATFMEKVRNKKIYYIALSLITTFLIVYFLKYTLRIPRPFEILEGVNQLVTETRGTSFPSAHAALSISFVTAVYLVTPRFKRYGFIKVLFAIAILIAYSRVYVGVHYPVDIAIGTLIGTLVSVGYFKFLKRYLD
jgi:undecaprenyl-diphosphatase